MSTYTLNVKNESVNNVRFAVFQEAPNVANANNVFTLAWFSKFAYAGTSVKFSWEIDYSAIWSRPGQELKPGVICSTSQSIPMELDGLNTITLEYSKENDAFQFTAHTKGEPGSIFTNCSNSVPNSVTTPSAAAGIGIAMSGAGTFLVDTQPNINLTWTPKPKYFLVAGDFKEGQILDVQTILGRALEIPYQGILNQEAYLDNDNQLKLKQ